MLRKIHKKTSCKKITLDYYLSLSFRKARIMPVSYDDINLQTYKGSQLFAWGDGWGGGGAGVGGEG
jgi:hypothetical protein